jgi:hypothetical protein
VKRDLASWTFSDIQAECRDAYRQYLQSLEANYRHYLRAHPEMRGTHPSKSASINAFFRAEGVRVVRTPVRAPNANAHMERWFGSIRRECLDRLLIFNRRQLERVVAAYVRHYNGQRPHRALELQTPDPLRRPCGNPAPAAIHRRDILGGIIHEYEYEYEAAAAAA